MRSDVKWHFYASTTKIRASAMGGRWNVVNAPLCMLGAKGYDHIVRYAVRLPMTRDVEQVDCKSCKELLRRRMASAL